ncbi:putative Excisionase [Mesorhizobium sp. ORS 3324]|nr:putative Excisionase [Mesorhizobium sp. ORS 3324]
MSIPEQLDNNTPLRLNIAAQIAFPDGSIGAAGLRKERDAGRLQTELIAGKEYVTLAAIAKMRELCRGRRKGHAWSGAPKVEGRTAACAMDPAGSSAMAQPSSALAVALETANALRNGSPNTSSKNTGRPASAAAIRPPSR